MFSATREKWNNVQRSILLASSFSFNYSFYFSFFAHTLEAKYAIKKWDELVVLNRKYLLKTHLRISSPISTWFIEGLRHCFHLLKKILKMFQTTLMSAHLRTKKLKKKSKAEKWSPDFKTQKKRSLLGQFCKLILHGVIPFSDAAPLLTHYVEVPLFPLSSRSLSGCSNFPVL